MPSPFPGMDPYLEAPDIWPDFHDRVANEISTDLNRHLPAPYYARLEMRPEVGIINRNPARRIVPDVAVARTPSSQAGGVAVLEAPRTAISDSIEIQVEIEPLRHHFVEIRDPSRGHELITLIEIVSPSNKRGGDDRQAYIDKKLEVISSHANLIELDLLRSGERLLGSVDLTEMIAGLTPTPDYIVLVNRAWRRAGKRMAYQIFPIMLADPLPCIPVPLRQGQDEVPLDLQFVANRAYDGGPYRRGAVNYGVPPDPPLSGGWSAWAQKRLHEAGVLEN